MRKRLVEHGNYKGHKYAIYKVMEHYELHLDGEFWASGDNYQKIDGELEEAAG